MGKSMYRCFFFTVFLIFIFSLNINLQAKTILKKKRTIQIGILQDGPYWYNSPLISKVKIELDKLNDGQFKIVYPKQFNLNAQYDPQKIKKYAATLLNSKLDAIISFGMGSSLYFSKQTPLPIPVVAMDFILPTGLGMLSPKTFKPINPNWTTSFDPTYVENTLKIFPKLLPVKKFAILCPKVICGFNSQIPSLIENFVKGDSKAKVVIITPQNYPEIISKLNTSLAIVEPLKGFTDKQMVDLYNLLIKRRIVSFTVDGLNGIKKGALVSIHDYNTSRMGRNFALKLYDIINNTPTDQIPVIDFKSAELIFNLETAEKIGYHIPFDFLDEARMYGKTKENPLLTFKKAIQLALNQNYDIKAQALFQNQAYLDVEITKRGFYPQVTTGLNYNRTNKSRADAFLQPRGEAKWEIQLEQRLYDRQLSKSIETAKVTNKIEKQNLEVLNQDIIEQVSLAYLDNLLGYELVNIQKDYLNVIRKNQSLAELKFKTRETGKSDILRLNIELENARIDLMDAKEFQFRAQVILNNLLNLPRETAHKFEEGSFSEKDYSKRGNRFSKYLLTMKQIKTFRDFFEQESLNNSPDLKALKTNLKRANVQKDQVLSQFYPTAKLQAEYFNQFQDSSQNFTPPQQQTFENRFGDGWQAQFRLDIPLFLGGARFKQLEQANSQILEFQARVNSLKNSLSQRSRSGLFNLFRSRKNLEFALRNVNSSKENLKLAEISYLEGDLPVIDLLDSQTRLILSITSATRTRYQFFKDLFALFRTVGRTDLIFEFDNEMKLGQFINQVNIFFKENQSTEPYLNPKN